MRTPPLGNFSDLKLSILNALSKPVRDTSRMLAWKCPNCLKKNYAPLEWAYDDDPIEAQCGCGHRSIVNKLLDLA